MMFRGPVNHSCTPVNTIISGLQSVIKIIYYINYSSSSRAILAGTTLCLLTWRYDAVPCSNFQQKPTCTTQIIKHYYKLAAVNRLKQGDSFEHWLVMYLLRNWFRIIFNQKELRTAALSCKNVSGSFTTTRSMYLTQHHPQTTDTSKRQDVAKL